MSSYFVISLDFELLWGVRDKRGVADYGDAVRGARRAVPLILDLFAREGVRATWACVGLLFFGDRDEMLASLPSKRPQYVDSGLDPYIDLEQTVGKCEEDDPYHFGISLIERIAQSNSQEIGTHTFSHYYCLEDGQDLDSFAADLAAAMSVARSRGLILRSIVFPRNQMTEQHLEVCSQSGIIAYRGNAKGSAYEAAPQYLQGTKVRLRRYVDSFVNLSGRQDRAIAPSTSAPKNIAASRFLRPHSGMAVPDRLRLRRIMTEMSHAASTGGLYHLWWHPHNFGRRTAENMRDLETLITHFKRLRSQHGMESASMGDLAARGLSAVC